MKVRSGLGQTPYALILLASLFVGGLLVRRAFTSQPGQTTVTRFPEMAADSTVSWSEMVVTYIGDADCPACTDHAFDPAMAAGIRRIRSEAEARGYLVRMVGVAITREIERGYEHLKAKGPWDEISVGAGWRNTHAGALVWEFNSLAVTPQIIARAGVVSRSPAGDHLFTLVGRPFYARGPGEIAALADRTNWDALFPASQAAGHGG